MGVALVPMRVRVPVTTLWVAPDSPRPVDRAVVAEEPDPAAWLAAMDEHPSDDESGAGRRGLQGRVHSQLLGGEPVLVVSEADAREYPGWVEVVCPWQPSSLDPRGYPGWLRRAHLVQPSSARLASTAPAERPRAVVGDSSAAADLDLARRHLGLAYLWGGLSPLGLDCSGLVHLVHRQLGRVLPRDAHDQQEACTPVRPESARPGDLYFFARPDHAVHHVGIVTGPGRMIHASERSGLVEEALDDRQRAMLRGAARVAPRTAVRARARV